MEKDLTTSDRAGEEKFVEGRDYYFEAGLLVMTEDYLRRRGYCCENGCRHCPYGFKARSKQIDG
jgi:hypothetical protein